MEGIRETCFSANHKWGECNCQNEFPNKGGFEFEGTFITDPTTSECGRFFVEPSAYYGKAYLEYIGRGDSK